MSETVYIVHVTRPALETTCYEVTVPDTVLADQGYDIDAALATVLDGCHLDGATAHPVGPPADRRDPHGTHLELDHEPESMQR